MGRKYKAKRILTPWHPQWADFINLLAGAEGVDYYEDAAGEAHCQCQGTTFYARRILEKYFSEIDLPATLAYFEDNGGFCDCEILFNCQEFLRTVKETLQ